MAVVKVQLFWEATKICDGFDVCLVNVKIMRTIAHIFVVFSEKLNFIRVDMGSFSHFKNKMNGIQFFLFQCSESLNLWLFLINKVQLFWKSHKNLQNLPHGLVVCYISKCPNHEEDCTLFGGLLTQQICLTFYSTKNQVLWEGRYNMEKGKERPLWLQRGKSISTFHFTK